MATLRRYTQLPFLLHMLKARSIALLSPNTWEDRNDAQQIEWYRQKKQLKSVLAACFTEAAPTYHHWKVFAAGTSGVCIEFDKARFQDWVESTPGLRGDTVTYMTLDALQENQPTVDELPFIKRFAYRDEREYRLLYDEPVVERTVRNIVIEPEMISSIVLNPWLNDHVSGSVSATIRGFKKCHKLSIRRASIVQSEEWQRHCKI